MQKKKATKLSLIHILLMLYRALDLRGTDRGNFIDVPKDSYYSVSYTHLDVYKRQVKFTV